MKIVKHIIIVVVALAVILGIPAAVYVDFHALFSADPADAVSSATLEIPDKPSGKFYVLVNKSLHGENLDQWNTFFSGKDAGVIMNDIDCMVASGDQTGIELADVYKARLPENQMNVKKDDGLLLASKAESGSFDTIVISKEYADSFRLQTVMEKPSVMTVTVEGEKNAED